MFDLEAALKQVGNEIDARFERLLVIPDDSRRDLSRAMRHAAIGGGKRLRPLLAVATANLFDVDRDHVGRGALALECIHVYSLIHDDLPAMDDDDVRRGRPTVHKIYGEATAILAGDCLHALAFEILADPATHPDPNIRAELVFNLARTSGLDGMAGGQMMDLHPDRSAFDLNTITRLQALKTGALITAAVETGAILGGASPEERVGLRRYSRDIGLAFQIVDDLLDADGQENLVGKKLRKDEDCGKATILTLLGPDRSRAEAAKLIEQAVDHLDRFGEKARLLRAIAWYILERDR